MKYLQHTAAALALCLAVATAARSQEYSSQPSPVDPHAMGPIAVVGSGRVGADQVFELWTPVWYETLAKVRNGKMTAAEGDAKLTAEWRRIIMALIKDELFYQEAEREHSSMINMIVDRIVSQGGAPRGQVMNDVSKAVQQDMERYFRQFSSQMVRESGGMVKLHRVLEGRGISFQDWQNRLRKKAFTQSYLHQILTPRTPSPGPKQIQDYYNVHADEFTLPGVMRFRHIFFSNTARGGADAAREAAVDVWEQIEDGEIAFEAAAAAYSDDEESKRRGGLETAEKASDPEREAWLADIRAALREERPGVVAPILESSFGCHVAVLLDIGPERRTPFSEARREIERKLHDEIWEAETDRYFASVRKAVDIRVIMRAFPPHLSCAAQSGLDSRTANVYQINKPNIETVNRHNR